MLVKCCSNYSMYKTSSKEIIIIVLIFFFAEKLEDLYAFSYNPQSEKLTRSAGWALFDIQSEYARMGLPNEEWCVSTLNKDYQVDILFI